MADLVQFDIFGNQEKVDTEKEKKAAAKKKKRSEAAKKAAETRRSKKEKAKQEWDNKYYKAFETEGGDLFGNKHSDEEKAEALKYVQTHKRTGGKRTPKNNNEGLERVIRRIVNEEARRVINENRQYTADDIYKEVLEQIYNYVSEIEVCVLRDELHIPTPDDYLRAYFTDSNTLHIEYKGDKREIPCDINLVSEKPEYVARLIMQGFAKIVYKIA